MKSLFFLIAFLLWSSAMIGQAAIDVSKTQKITKDGIEVTIFQEKPFTGYLTENYPNGKPKTWKTMKNGMAEGLWQEWLENGKLRYNAHWKEGKGHGLWQYFHDNGTLKYEEAYLMDIPNGISRAYYNNGRLMNDNFWLNGKKQGVWSAYSETGILVKTDIYEDDKLISTTENKK